MTVQKMCFYIIFLKLTLLVRFRLQSTNSLKCGSVRSAFCQGRIPDRTFGLCRENCFEIATYGAGLCREFIKGNCTNKTK